MGAPPCISTFLSSLMENECFSILPSVQKTACGRERSSAVALGGQNRRRSEEAVDEEFTDAEIRVLLKKAASDRRRDEMRQRQERAGTTQDKPEDATTTSTPRDTPLEQEKAA
jgi:hypothetical protein